jgi:hypothetical protein
MITDLQLSWEKHHNILVSELAEDESDNLLPLLRQAYSDVEKNRELAEKYALAMLTASAKDKCVKHNLFHLVHRVPSATVADLIRSSFDKAVVPQLNPFLSQNARKQLDSVILHFLKLCVLEDKLKRLVSHASTKSKDSNHRILQELNSVRSWNVADHPSWLAFEVENMLQIRPEQFELAQHLLDHPASVSQLNMGNYFMFLCFLDH